MTDETLLTDEEFVGLMEAEAAARRHRVDDVAKQRMWVRIEAGLAGAGPGQGTTSSAERAPAAAHASTPPARRAPIFAAPIAMAALLALTLIPSLLSRPTQDAGLKGEATGLPVTLSTYVLGADGALQPFTPAAAAPGTTLVFKTLTPSSAVVALTASEPGHKAEIRFVGSEARGGSEQLLEQSGRAYGYRLEAGHPPLRFCAVAESTLDRLTALLDRLAAASPRLPAGACVDIPAGGR